jgi:beta-glucosidase
VLVTTSQVSPPDRLGFPPGFLWGAATSSHQVEGSAEANDWWAWERADPSRIRGGRLSGEAAGWWALGWAERDLTAAARLGHGAHRLGLEWSRLAPHPGKRSHAATDRYRAILGHARDLGLRTFVTLHHFTLPQWLAAAGGWRAPGTAEALAVHSAASARDLGDLVDGFFTINEPTVLALKAFFHGMWPPGRQAPHLAARAVREQLRGHALAYRAVKAERPDTPVGLALNLPTVSPARSENLLDRRVAAAQDWMVNGSVLHALRTGVCRPPVGNRPTSVPGLAGSFDFLGINYYGRYLTRFAPDRPGMAFGRFVQEPTVRTDSADWGQPSPAGLVATLKRAAGLGRPLYVSENGVFDPTDALRCHYLVEHLRALQVAASEGMPVRGYFHWSLVDNFEWAQGWTTPFGLVALDPVTQARRARPSAHLLAEVARRNRLPAELAECADPVTLARAWQQAAKDPYERQPA